MGLYSRGGEEKEGGEEGEKEGGRMEVKKEEG